MQESWTIAELAELAAETLAATESDEPSPGALPASSSEGAPDSGTLSSIQESTQAIVASCFTLCVPNWFHLPLISLEDPA